MSKSLRESAMEAAKNSHSPYSKYKVGSAVELDNGEIISGCNIENSSFGGTVCAERVAIWKAVSEGKNNFKRIYVYTEDGWPPCGLCAQVMAEFFSKDVEVIIGDKDGDKEVCTFGDILPKAFTPEYLKK